MRSEWTDQNPLRDPAVPPSALQRWWARMAGGTTGEDPERPSTWKLDDLWRAACDERAREEWDAIVAKPLPKDPQR